MRQELLPAGLVAEPQSLQQQQQQQQAQELVSSSQLLEPEDQWLKAAIYTREPVPISQQMWPGEQGASLMPAEPAAVAGGVEGAAGAVVQFSVMPTAHAD